MINELKLCHLYKKFSNQILFTNLNYAFIPGSFAITGKNGTGKSTLLKMMCGAETPDSGNIFINGIDLHEKPQKAKQALAYVPDQSFVYPFLSGKEFLLLTMQLRGRTDDSLLDYYLTLFDVKSFLTKSFSKMSLGTQKKFMLVSSLIHEPSLLIMDEPTNGLDELSRNHLLEIVKKRTKKNITIFATHDINFIEKTSATTINLNHTVYTT